MVLLRFFRPPLSAPSLWFRSPGASDVRDLIVFTFYWLGFRLNRASVYFALTWSQTLFSYVGFHFIPDKRQLFFPPKWRMQVCSPRSTRVGLTGGVRTKLVTPTPGGELVVLATPIPAREAEKVVAEDGEVGEAGAPLVTPLTRVVVDGVPPARTPTPLVQALRSRPHRVTPGDHQVPHRAHLKALWIPPLPAGAYRGTLGVRLVGGSSSESA